MGELKQRMGYSEFVEWLAYYQVEPFGEARQDLRNAMLLSMFANINRDPKKRANAFVVSDFMPKFWETEEEKPSLFQKFRAMSEVINAQNGQHN